MSNLILLVEDNASDEKLTLLAFKNCGVTNEIVVARDGAAALDFLFGQGAHAARDPHDVPALVLLDLKLPKIDGLEVLQRIRSNPLTHLLPIVVLTASKQDDDIQQSYQRGANAYVQKPVDFAEFARAAKTIGAFWLGLNQAAPPGTR